MHACLHVCTHNIRKVQGHLPCNSVTDKSAGFATAV